jgi:2'-5' RNA ligase
MGLVRAFIAIEIPHSIQQAIYRATSTLRDELGAIVRWVPPQNIHLTLKFLGDVSPTQVDLLTQSIRAEADSHPPFEMHIRALGSFPSLRRARILWVGIQASAELEALNRGVESACVRLGYESESRPFSPHLTIGRVRQDVSAVDGQKIRRALTAAKVDSLGSVRVDSVQVFKSDLKPDGAVYTKLFSAPLRTVVTT